MITLLLTLQIQSPWMTVPPTATVGDTIRVVRQVAAASGVQARIAPLPDVGSVIQLSDPRASFAEGAVTIQYTVAAFAPGTLKVAMPDAELLYPEGRSELVTGDTAWLVVTSVLTDDAAAPRAMREPIEQSRRRAWPVVALGLGAVASTLGWGLLRRRTRRRRAVPGNVAETPYPPVDRWIAAGEGRAVTAYVTERVRHALSALVPSVTRDLDTEACIALLEIERPELPIADISGVLRDLDQARFAPVVRSTVADVVDRAEALLRSLHEPAGRVP